ncbi:unnamed protein product [Didymodactylos carnosus]|uniref:Uncharacterized protein n=1 Tax=Didymodactylos carnosus TaxID=1234261 RepID=A0A816CMC7_9BILA|nr:unnamed protein product [Didymodactylos carnosus]CAF1622186.1 unnamed protein product [Didymodactylos carnosus]CAF4200439.1 unnamed protein product [Didymodactylos carnosus]CAF4513569.1 unnamed protein product [Didymodactylos carnosus]
MSNSKLELLSNELLMIVFECIEIGQVFYGFYNLNQRLNSLLFDHRPRFHCEIDGSSKNLSRLLLYKHQIIPSNLLSQIQTLVLVRCNLKEYGVFHQNYQTFTALESLTLNELSSRDIEHVLRQFQLKQQEEYIPNLKRLIILNPRKKVLLPTEL